MRALTIGEAAAALETYPAKLRRYEAVGLIPRARRTPASNERVWMPREIGAIRTILKTIGKRRPSGLPVVPESTAGAPVVGPLYRIGEVARMIGVHPHSIRKAEWRGAIRAARQERWGDDRVYTPADVERLRGWVNKTEGPLCPTCGTDAPWKGSLCRGCFRAKEEVRRLCLLAMPREACREGREHRCRMNKSHIGDHWGPCFCSNW